MKENEKHKKKKIANPSQNRLDVPLPCKKKYDSFRKSLFQMTSYFLGCSRCLIWIQTSGFHDLENLY